MYAEVYRIAKELESRKTPFAIATVIRVEGSSSAKSGSKAIIDSRGTVIAGWVGGGCAEAAVRAEAQKCILEERTAILTLDLTDEVLGVGMPCGGKMDIFIDPFSPTPELLIVGHSRIAEMLATLGQLLHFSVIVSDPSADRKLFPTADRLITDDMDFNQTPLGSNSYVVIASQHKNDQIWIKRALEDDAAYIALVASRKRSKLVLEYAQAAGVPEEKLSRVHAPAGLEIGAREPEEIALSVMSEIVSVRRGGFLTGPRPKPGKDSEASTPTEKTAPRCGT
jgi:xanthine dehydrogenase accessory factor